MKNPIVSSNQHFQEISQLFFIRYQFFKYLNAVLFSRSGQVSENQQQTHSSTQPPSIAQEMAQEDTTRLRITIESGMELLTQTIAEDLNRLQSLQVVSNMMRSGFREDLEHIVQVGKPRL